MSATRNKKNSSSSSSSNGDNDVPTYDIDPAMLENEFVSVKAKNPLRVCCYGSSSSKTPAKFLKEAWNLGYILARRGHTCVNGAGSYGCMAAMNDGADAGNGHIVGVIHEMFLVDGNDWLERDGGAHNVFNKDATPREGPTREILIAGGHDLQERKRLLVQDADALVVLPGGPGTWDELWEMSCARNLGLTDLPIVCVSVEGFYDNFGAMLKRAYEEGLVKNKPEDVVHFVPTAENAVRWIESRNDSSLISSSSENLPKIKTRNSVLRRTSFFAPPSTFLRSMSWFSDDGEEEELWSRISTLNSWIPLTATVISFTAGLAVGVAASMKYRTR